MGKPGGWKETGFGVRLKVLRQGAGLTQKQLAAAVGCHRLTIAKLEQGVQQPEWGMVLALADTLGVSADTFRGDGQQPEPKMGRPPASDRRRGTKKDPPGEQA